LKGLQLEPLGQKSERERGRKGWAALGRICKNNNKSGAVCSMVSFLAEVLADCKQIQAWTDQEFLICWAA